MSLDPAPFSFRAGKTGCLLIHGFTGTPGEMRPLGSGSSKRVIQWRGGWPATARLRPSE